MLVPEGLGSSSTATFAAGALLAGGLLRSDGRVSRDLNFVLADEGHGETYDDENDWRRLRFELSSRLWAEGVVELDHLAVEPTYETIELLDSLTCADPYYGAPEYAEECPCQPGEVRACGDHTACTDGTKVCGDDGVFAACVGAVHSTTEAPCTSPRCPLVFTPEVILDHRGTLLEAPVETVDGCSWVGAAQQSWLSAVPDTTVGSGKLAITATVNGATERVGAIAIGSLSMTVRQQKDAEPPMGTFVVGDGVSWVTTTSVPVTITASDPNGVAAMCITLDVACSNYVPFNPNPIFQIGAGSGNSTMRIWLRDGVGNKSARPIEVTFRRDTNPPTIPSGWAFTVVPGDATVALSWPPMRDDWGSGIASYRLVTGPTTPASCASGEVLVEASPATTFTHTGLENGRVYYYRLCATDNVGWENAGAITLARPAPEFNPPTAVVSINAGAAYTNNVNVQVSIDASDASGVASMCVTENSSCTTFVPFAPTAAFRLYQQAGLRRINVFLSDIYGNTSTTPLWDDIVLDLTAATDAALAATASDRRVDLSWGAASDPSGSGVASYRVVYSTASSPAAKCASGTEIYSGNAVAASHLEAQNGTRYYYRVCAVDRAGNVSSGAVATAVPAERAEPARGHRRRQRRRGLVDEHDHDRRDRRQR